MASSAIQEIASLLFMVHENYLKDVVGDANVLLALVSLTEDVGLSEIGAHLLLLLLSYLPHLLLASLHSSSPLHSTLLLKFSLL